MTELLLLLIAVCVLVCMAIAYARSRDPLHPLMYLGPMLLYVYTIKPWSLLAAGELQKFLTDRQIEFAAMMFALGTAAFCAGVLLGGGRTNRKVRFEITPAMRPRLVRLGVWLGMLSVASYWFTLFLNGGFVQVYSRSKAFLHSGSGYIDELVNLSIPAVALLVLAWGGDRRFRHYVLWALFFASPLLIHGLLGARRGPTFMILTAMVVAWYIRSRSRAALWKVVMGIGLICSLSVFLMAHRRDIRLGADINFSLAKFWAHIAPEEVDTADDTVFMYGFSNGVHDTGRHYWGVRYAATYLVRPIPKQLWPTKYQDLGLGWMVNQSEFAGTTDEEWERCLGWVPQRGAATGFVGDLYLEFGWAALAGCLVFGWSYGWLWRRAVVRRGLWTLLFLQAAALSIYVPTQSVSAVLHRFLVMSVPLIIIWRMYIGRAGTAGGGAYDRQVRQPVIATLRRSPVVVRDWTGKGGRS